MEYRHVKIPPDGQLIRGDGFHGSGLIERSYPYLSRVGAHKCHRAWPVFRKERIGVAQIGIGDRPSLPRELGQLVYEPVDRKITGQSANQPVRRQNKQAWIVPGDEAEHHEIRLVIFVDLPGLPQSVGVVHCSRVAVMAVGDKNRNVTQRRGDGVDHALIVHDPEFLGNVAHLALLCGVRLVGGRPEQIGNGGFRIVKEPEDRRHLRVRNLGELQAVGLGPGERVLVRDHILAQFSRPDTAQHCPARVALARPRVGLFVSVKRRRTILHHHARSLPAFQQASRTVVFLVGTELFGRNVGQVNRDDIVFTAGEQFGLFLGVKNIVRWGDQIADVAVCVSPAAKWANVHGSLSVSVKANTLPSVRYCFKAS